jgi:hypothetical protein
VNAAAPRPAEAASNDLRENPDIGSLTLGVEVRAWIHDHHEMITGRVDLLGT